MTRRLWAVFRKELRTLFASPMAYVVLTAFVALTGVYFFQHLISFNQLLFAFQSQGLGSAGFDQGTVPVHINSVNELFIPFAGDVHLFLLAVIPLVTMRVFAEERATGTDELLLTTPLRPWEFALAKHAATYLFVMLLLAVSALYPAIVTVKSHLGLAHLGALYLGQLCYGIAIASIGLACSSWTRSQLVAAVVAYAVPFILLDFMWLEPALGEATARVLREVALQGHLDRFTRGVLELRDATYFASLAVLSFTISVAAIELQRAR